MAFAPYSPPKFPLIKHVKKLARRASQVYGRRADFVHAVWARDYHNDLSPPSSRWFIHARFPPGTGMAAILNDENAQ
jgi:hypothetical protein